MKPTPADVEHRGDLGGEKIKFHIDAASLAHIMDTLTDLYKDPLAATLREPVSNARDSHVEAGQTRPIEVSLPGPLSTYFVVQDWGTGMSREDILTVFTAYGASTKRESDDYTGMLGLGAKAPLTYAPMFRLTTVKDGRKIVAVVTRTASDKDPTPELELFESDTDEPNGTRVEVEIATHHHVRFQRIANEFFSYWRGGVLVDGEEPERVDGLWLDDDVVVTRGLNGDQVVMGDVAYPTGSRLINRGLFSVVTWVPMGAVLPTPSREHLKDLPQTRDTLETIAEFVRDRQSTLNEHVARIIEGAPTYRDAVLAEKEWNPLLDRKALADLRWQGRELTKFIRSTPGYLSHCSVTGVGVSGRSSVDALSLADKPFDVIITGYPLKHLTEIRHGWISAYLKDKGYARAFVVNEAENLDLLPGYATTPQVDWEVVKDAAPPSARPARTASKGFRQIEKSRYGVSTLDPSKTIVAYIHPSQFSTSNSVYVDNPKVAQFFNLIPDRDHVIAVVRVANLSAFKKEHPGVPHVAKIAEQHAWSEYRKVTEADTHKTRWERLLGWSFWVSFATGVDLAHVADPEVRGILSRIRAAHHGNPQHIQHALAARRLAQRLDAPNVPPTPPTGDEDSATNPLSLLKEHAPLLVMMSQRFSSPSTEQQDLMLEHLNALHTYRTTNDTENVA